MAGLVRCGGCGAITWNVLVRLGAHPVCSDCGAELKPDRRRPGTKFHRKGAERRNLEAPEGGFAQRPPAQRAAARRRAAEHGA